MPNIDPRMLLETVAELSMNVGAMLTTRNAEQEPRAQFADSMERLGFIIDCANALECARVDAGDVWGEGTDWVEACEHAARAIVATFYHTPADWVEPVPSTIASDALTAARE